MECSKARLLLILAVFIGIPLTVSAQESKPARADISIGADFVSSYLWRGLPQGNAPAIQPWGELSYKGFTFGTWSSFEFTGNFKEIDLYAKYTYKDFSLMVIDFFFPEYKGLNQDYFDFKNETTGHAGELAISFNGSDKIPFTVYAGVVIYGIPIDHQVNDTLAMNYSSYFEINYLGKLNQYTYNVFLGFTPTESYLYGTKQFSIFNVGLSAKKEIKITKEFNIPMKLTLATNPVSKKFFVTLLLSL